MECECKDVHDIREYSQKLLRFNSVKFRIGFGWKEERMKLFAVCLNLALTVQEVRWRLAQHDCGKACMACRIKGKVDESGAVDVEELIGNNEKLMKRVRELKGFVEGLEFVVGIFKVGRRLRIERRFKCGFRAVMPVRSLSFDLTGYLQEICKFFPYFIGKSLLFWYSNSVLIKNFKTLKNYFYLQVQNQNYSINENIHSGLCCDAEFENFSNKFSILYFELNWNFSKYLAFDIAQVCVGLTDSIQIGTKIFYLHKFMVRKENNEDFVECWKSEDGCWNVSDGDEMKMNLNWFSTICFMLMNKLTPCFFVYRVEELPETPLSEIEIYKIEELVYLILQEKTCFKFVSKLMIEGIEEEKITLCFYCGNQKFEGIECEICKYNETNWRCECGWFNAYLFIT